MIETKTEVSVDNASEVDSQNLGETDGGTPMHEEQLIHRIGGASVDNLRMKPKESMLKPPGISVIKAANPDDAVAEMKAAYPDATRLHEAAQTVGSSTIKAIQSCGYDVIPVPSRRLPNHYRLIHPDGEAGFTDNNLEQLAQVFTNTTGH